MYRKVHIGPLFVESGGESTVYLNSIDNEKGAASGISNRVFLTVTNCGSENFDKTLCLFINPYENLGRNLQVTVSGFWDVKERSDERTGQVYWEIAPLYKDFPLLPDESFSILMDHIICQGDREAMVCLGIEIEDTGEMGYIPVFKKYHDVMAKRFVCNRNTAGVLDTVQFDWETLGNCSHCYFLPGSGDAGAEEVKPQGVLARTVYESTNYALLMQRGEVTLYAKSPVTVLEPEILDFWADQVNIRYGTAVNLNFRLKNTYHAYIDNGIGRVEGTAEWEDGTCTVKGVCRVLPKWRVNVYTLSILGKDTIYEKSLTIHIEKYLTESSLSFSRTYEDGMYSYKLMWNVDNCTKILLKTSDGTERSGGLTKGNCTFRDASPDAMRLQVELEGEDGQKRSYEKKCDDAGSPKKPRPKKK